MKMKLIASAVGLAALVSVNAHAALLVDDFQTAASVVANDTPVSVTSADFSGTDLTGADRQMTANSFNPIPGANQSDIIADFPVPGQGVLSVSNNSTSGGGTTRLFYDGFGTVDFTAGGSALIVEVLGVDLGVSLAAVVNGTSSSPVFNFNEIEFGVDDPESAFLLYDDFSDPSELTAVTSLEVIYTGSQPWDGLFAFLRSDAPPGTPVPVPATLLLMGLGMAGLGWSRRRKA